MTDNRGFRVSWLITLAILLATLSIALGDRVLSHWSYSLERGRIQAASDQLADAGKVSNSFRLVAKIARPGVVHISVSGGTFERKSRGSDRDEETGRARRRPPASGSGFIIDEEGHILTNSHVVADRDRFTVTLFDDRSYSARLVGSDPKSDLALLKIDATDLHPLKFGDSDAAEVGDWVLAVGAPFGLTQSVTHGIISAKGRGQRTRIPGVEIRYQNFIQTDAAINPGNSGGPLLNMKGEVIGVNTAIATNGDSYNAGIAFTIPSNMARKIADQLKSDGKVTRGWLGISLSKLTEDDVETLGMKDKVGVMVDIVFEDSPAYRARLMTEDVTLSVNGTAVTDVPQIQALIADISPGDPANFKVWRDRKERPVRVRLARQADDLGQRTSVPILALEIRQLGIRARSLRPELFDRFGPLLQYGYGTVVSRGRHVPTDHGVLIIDAVRGGALSDIDIEPGDVLVECNGKTIRSVYDLNLALSSTKTRKSIKLKVLNADGDKRTVYVKRAKQ